MSLERERFQPDELAVVLSHYDLGVIFSAKEFARGSRRSPKLLLRAERGRFLLKRRAPGRDDPFKVAFAHTLLAHLQKKGVCVPAMVGTRDDHNSMLQHEGRVYELFQFVDGLPHDSSLEQTTSAGQTLGRYHAAVADFRSEWSPPQGSFHDADAVRNGLNSIPTTTAGHDSVVGREAELLGMTQELYERYDEAAARVNAAGFAGWPCTHIHGDWHPGNMLFHGKAVVAVLDLDSARWQPPVIDLANGILQFSILRGQDAPAEWPEYFDETRMRRFLRGYLETQSPPPEPRGCIPDLMIESLISECVVPIAMTGSLGRMPGFGVLQMVRRKVRWLLQNAERLRQRMSE